MVKQNGALVFPFFKDLRNAGLLATVFARTFIILNPILASFAHNGIKRQPIREPNHLGFSGCAG